MWLVAMDMVSGSTITGTVLRGKVGDSFDLTTIRWREVGVPEKLHLPMRKRLRAGALKFLCDRTRRGAVCHVTTVGRADCFWSADYAMLEKDEKWRGNGIMVKKVDGVGTRISSSPISFPSSW